MSVQSHIDKVLRKVEEYSPGQDEFYQAAHEVLHSLIPLLEEDNRYDVHNILERIMVPELSLIHI